MTLDITTTIAALTLDQKVALLAGVDTWHTASFDDPPIPADPHVGRTSRGPRHDVDRPGVGVVPVRHRARGDVGPRARRGGRPGAGREARSKSAHVVLAPTVNLHRTPIGGRNFECFSEDPVLTSRLGTSYIRGLQRERVAACVKHFVGNDTELDRMTISSQIDERTLRELYLVPFEAAVVDAGVRSIMTAYNRLNGTYCSEHPWLITDLLRGEWGFDGAVISDWFGTHSAVASVRAGLDLEMPGPPRERGAALRAAVERGDVRERELDPLVARVLALGEWVGAGATGTDEATADDAAHARRHPGGRDPGDGAAEERRRRPAAGRATARRIALIGPYARFGRPQGGGSARVRPDHGRGPFDALDRPRLRRDAGARRLDRQVPPGRARRVRRPVRRRGRRGRRRPRRAGSRGSGTARRPTASTSRGSRRASAARSCRTRRGLGARRAGHRAGDREPRRRARGDDHGADAQRRLLRHGQPGGARHGGAGGGPALRAHRRLPGQPGERAGARPRRRCPRRARRRPHRPRRGDRGGRRRRRRDRRDRRRLGDRGRGPQRPRAAARPGRPRRRRRGGQPEHGRRAQHGVTRHDAVARLRARGAADVVPRPGARRRARRRADGRCRARRAPAGHVPAAARGHAGVRALPGCGRRHGGVRARACSSVTGGTTATGSSRCSRSATASATRRSSSAPPPSAAASSTVSTSPSRSATPARGRAARSCSSTSSRPPATTPVPVRTLAGFARIDLAAGEQGTVAITLGRRAFVSWLDGAWTVTPGEYVIHAGRSSRDLARAGHRHRRLGPARPERFAARVLRRHRRDDGRIGGGRPVRGSSRSGRGRRRSARRSSG